MFGGIGEFFAPGRRHLEEERNRLLLTRDDEGSAAPPNGPIDLDSGVVVIRRPDAAGDTAEPEEPDAAGDGARPAVSEAPGGAADETAADDRRRTADGGR